MAEASTPGEDAGAKSAKSRRAAAALKRELFESSMQFSQVFTKAVLSQLLNEDALKKGALSGKGMDRTIAAAAKAVNKRVRKVKHKRDNRFTVYNLYVLLACTHTGVKSMAAAGACWKGMRPELRRDLEARLEAIKDTCNDLVRAADGEKVHVAEQLALYERQQRLKPFPWKTVMAPYAGMANTGGRVKKEGAPQAAAAEGGAGGAAADAAGGGKPKKHHKQHGEHAAAGGGGGGDAEGGQQHKKKHKKHHQHAAE